MKKAHITPPLVLATKLLENKTILYRPGVAMPYVACNIGGTTATAISDDGQASTINKRGNYWTYGNEILFTEAMPKELKGECGLYYQVRSRIDCIQYIFYDSYRRFMSVKKTVKDNIYYKGKLYTYVSNPGVRRIRIKNKSGTEEVLIKDVRVFKTKKDATMFKNSIAKLWEKATKEVRKLQSLADKYGVEEGGYAKIDMKAYKKHGDITSVMNVLISDNPTVYCTTVKLVGKGKVVTDKFQMIPLEILVGVTQKEMSKGKAEEEANRANMIIGRALIAAMERELANKNTTIKTLQASLIHRLRESTELMDTLCKGDYKAGLSHLHKQLDSLRKYKNIASVELVDKQVIIKTKNLNIETTTVKDAFTEYLPIEIGAFAIYIDLIDYRLQVKHLNRTSYSYLQNHHPHQGWNGNDMCLGNMNNQVYRNMRDLDIESVADIVLHILEHIENDSYSHRIERLVRLDRLEAFRKKPTAKPKKKAKE